MGAIMSTQEWEAKLQKRNKIALALVEQCKSEGEMTASDLIEVFRLALHYVRL